MTDWSPAVALVLPSLIKSDNLIDKLNYPQKIIHSLSNAIFPLVESAFLALIAFYCIQYNLNLYAVGLIIGLVILLTAVLFPLVVFLIDKTDNLFFGTHHAPLLVSIFLISIFNAQFFALGQLDMGGVPTIMLMSFVVFVVQLSLGVYRHCNHAIGNRMCFVQQDKNVFKLLKNFAFVFGVLLSACFIGLFLYLNLDLDNIGFFVSIIVLVLGLADFFTTYQYVPIIKLYEVTKRIKTKEKLKDIYLDFIKSFSLRGRVKQFLAFVLSITFFTMFFVSDYIYISLFLDGNDIQTKFLVATFTLLIGLATCVVGAFVFYKIFKPYDFKKISMVNLVVSCTWVAIFAVFYILVAINVVQFNWYLSGVVFAVLGFLVGANYVAYNRLFVDQLNIKSPYNLCTIVYLFCFGVVVIIIGVFVGLYVDSMERQSQTGENVAIIMHSLVAMLMYIGSSVLFLLAFKDKTKKLKTKTEDNSVNNIDKVDKTEEQIINNK